MLGSSCVVCGSLGPFIYHEAREMLFGTREEFEYQECEGCASVQIRSVPEASVLARHYPDNYYSFNASASGLRQWLYTQRDRYLIGRRSFVGAVIARLRPDTTLPLLMRAGVAPHHRIVDVGCGHAHLLERMARLGFANLQGVDPFIAQDLKTAAGVPVKRVTISEVDGEFDVVMFHHSLEHVPDPEGDLVAARAHLSDGGVCIVRLPTPDSVGWRQHSSDWSSLDPPRHLVLPSRNGLIGMAARAGLTHVETIDDSYGGQYLISELYSRGISASDPEAQTTFGDADQARFEAVAEEANRTGRGDQAMFVFRKVDAAVDAR